jgi:hypothetical protein
MILSCTKPALSEPVRVYCVKYNYVIKCIHNIICYINFTWFLISSPLISFPTSGFVLWKSFIILSFIKPDMKKRSLKYSQKIGKHMLVLFYEIFFLMTVGIFSIYTLIVNMSCSRVQSSGSRQRP